MQTIHHQSEANKVMEGGLFYPTGYVVAAFPSADDARTVRDALLADGFEADAVQHVDAATMEHEAAENLEHRGLMAVGASVPVREKQLELARQGCDFLLVCAPEDQEEKRVVNALSKAPVRYAVKYRRLIIENLIPEIPSSTSDSEPARVP
ncbi:MAG TPA: hypothetical protein VJM11_17860 [Nevskiaceae bacterium]|nr:hypothetical protein [Nevskiaceae bacterium]